MIDLLWSVTSFTMPHAVPDHDTYMLYTDDEQEFDVYQTVLSKWHTILYLHLRIWGCCSWSPPRYLGPILPRPTASYGCMCFFLSLYRHKYCTQIPQLKPAPGSTSNDVQIHQLFRDYSVQIWSAGLESWNTYYFDFVDPLTSHSVNLPLNWRIVIAHSTLSSVASQILCPIVSAAPDSQGSGGNPSRRPNTCSNVPNISPKSGANWILEVHSRYVL